MCLTIFSPDIWPGEGFSYCLRICSGATRIFTEWSPSLYRDDALSSMRAPELLALRLPGSLKIEHVDLLQDALRGMARPVH